MQLFFERSQQAMNELSQKYGKLCFHIALNILKCNEDTEECENDITDFFRKKGISYKFIWSRRETLVNPYEKTYTKIVQNSRVENAAVV